MTLAVGLLVVGLAVGGCSSEERADSSATTIPSGAPAKVTTTTAVGRPARVLVVGDSLAFLVALSLAEISVEHGMEVRTAALMGCGLLRGPQIRYGVSTVTESRCDRWPERFQRALDEFQPDRVVVINGFWDAYDVIVDGSLVEFGTPAWDEYARAEFGAAMDLLSSGPLVLWLGSPYFQNQASESPEARYFRTHGEYRSAYDEARVDHLDDLFRGLAVERSGTGRVAFIDIRGLVCPSGTFEPTVEGVQIRDDGVHFTPDGAVKVARWVTALVAGSMAGPLGTPPGVACPAP
ncbi:MAG: SGNH hydrolase domain-containing protein [Acidimicrobiia bacterium]